jgi:hypothetical protein
MKNISTGFGLCVLGLGIAAWPVLDRIMPTANASAVTAAAAAVSTAATAQAGPTIVWYGTDTVTRTINYETNAISIVFRAWSDGRVEALPIRRVMNYGSSTNQYDLWCNASGFCIANWMVISDPAQGLTYRSDINFDEKVDGADLATLLTDWGNAPRQDIPPSDCPLALINP